MDEGIRQHKMDALAAINFEFLAETPINQSGKAKEVDYEALNNTVHSIAEDVVAAMDNAIYLIAKFRYGGLYGDEEIREMLPDIAVPERFDIMGSSRIMNEIASAKTNEANPVIKSALEVDYCSKRFSNEPEVRDMVSLVLSLDPLQNISEDDKMSRLSNKGITLESYVISSNIEEFVKRAIQENEDFARQPINQQKEKLKQYAQEVIELNNQNQNQNMIPPDVEDTEEIDEDFETEEIELNGNQSTERNSVNDQQSVEEIQ